MTSRKALYSFLALTLLVFTCTAAMCSPEQKKAAVSGTAVGISTAATVISGGIPTVRAYRESGEITREKSLELARWALDANAVLGEVTGFILAQDKLDESGRAQLYGQARELLNVARNLRAKGVIKLKSGKQQLIFDLTLTGGDIALETMVTSLATPLPDGKLLEISPKDRATLELARDRIAENDKTLKEAIQRLSQM